MGHVDYGLLWVSFLLGLVLTFALTIRRVTREVPVRPTDTHQPEDDQPE
jgi:hypothetical protein